MGKFAYKLHLVFRIETIHDRTFEDGGVVNIGTELFDNKVYFPIKIVPVFFVEAELGWQTNGDPARRI